jgi:hypothetical protein
MRRCDDARGTTRSSPTARQSSSSCRHFIAAVTFRSNSVRVTRRTRVSAGQNHRIHHVAQARQ